MTTENQEVTNNTAPEEDTGATAAPAPAQARPGRNGGDNEGAPAENTGRPGAGSAPVRRARRPGGKDRFAPRRRVDQFGLDGIRDIDYKDFQRLRRYLSDRGKIEPRRKTGLSAFHQRSLTTAIKRARYMALLPYVANQSR
ncbi:MAG TPA: 30S ribosomal protein S18 [Chloroflexia bacterium]|nr:30S ribosomal protein S18 [Chloroflexia bacterium]